MNKTAKIILTVVSILFVLSFAAWLLVPRILLAVSTKAILDDVGEAATYFTEYDVRNEDVQTIDNGHITIDIPADYTIKDTHIDSVTIYKKPETNLTLLMIDSDNMSEMNLLKEENLSEYLTDVQFNIGTKQLTKGFEALGNGLPDSAYNTFKCIWMLDKEDNSFWNINQATAFFVTGTLKNILIQYENTMIYETDDICGFVGYTQLDNGTFRVRLEMYQTDDLNTVSTVMLRVKDLETAYAVMNSARASE
ncbi:MAG: hypothetical protein E7504_01275 [Ruminococcus sp.]|nr:hypothetical protein [Ruminococcus sp.]